MIRTLKYLLVLYMIFFGHLLTGQAKTSHRVVKIMDKITVLLPQEFNQMTQQDIFNKFISYRQPQAGFTTEDRLVDFVVNVSHTPWLERDIDLLKSFYENSIRNLFDEVNFLQDTVRAINGKNFAVFEFISTVRGDPNSLRNQSPVINYQYVQYAVKGKQVFIFTIQCPARLREQWQTVAGEIMSSIRFQ